MRSTALRNGLLAWLLVGLSYRLSSGLSDGLSVGLSVGLLSLLLIGKSMTVQVTDRLIWSWTRLGRSLRSSPHVRATLQIAALVVLGFALSNRLGDGPIVALSVGLSVGLSYWLLIGLFQGVPSEIIGDQQRMAPNQGIRRSAFNGLVLGCISAIISGLSVGLSAVLSSLLSTVLVSLNGLLNGGLSDWLSGLLSDMLNYWLSDMLSNGLYVGLIVGLSAGLLAGLLKGGLACLRHYVLRFQLWRARAMPWNYPRFLDYAAEHILLRKVGGGYIFIHRFLLEYFASLDTTSPPDTMRAKKQQA